MTIRKTICGAAMVAVAVLVAGQAQAKASNEAVMKATGECVYVVHVAESNGARLNHSSEQWAQVIHMFAERYKLDAKSYVDKAKAKYRKRSKVMGADEALSHMMQRAKACDKELEGL
ncbi:MAG: hypothetical protein ACR2PC_18115 [Tsuneonella suprasediminis]|nr:hypothetical protein [Tsuneonella suprasediminis]UBS33172.1 hypothetical protein LBX01_00590 [Altererythrobacter sp. N1]